MNLRDSLKAECIETGFSANDKELALHAVAKIAKRCPELSGIDQQTIFAALLEREKTGSTGIGDGIAIPHCRLPEVTDFVVGLITLATPVEFDAADNKPVKLLAFIITPEEMSEAHVVLLSQLSQLLVGPGAVEKIISAVDPVGLYQYVMAKLVPENINDKANWPASLFQIILSNEDLLYDLLPIFSAISGCQAVVGEVVKSSSFLRHMPLFASFWTASSTDDLKFLTAIVPKAMTNEVIRQVDQRTGGIAGRNDALLMVQDLFFCSGSLS